LLRPRMSSQAPKAAERISKRYVTLAILSAFIHAARFSQNGNFLNAALPYTTLFSIRLAAYLPLQLPHI